MSEAGPVAKPGPEAVLTPAYPTPYNPSARGTRTDAPPFSTRRRAHCASATSSPTAAAPASPIPPPP